MEAPLHRSLLPLPASSWQLQPHDAMMGAAAAAALHQQPSMNAQNPPPPPQKPGPGREQCPRCASRDTKFCYYNNYNTAQPRHFCRACRRYWTLGGSLRNVPVGGATRKRPRPSSRGPARAAASSSFFPAVVAAAPAARAQQNDVGLLSSLFLLGSGPLLEGLGLGQPAFAFGSTVGAGDLLAQLGFGFGFGATPLPPWPATVSEFDRAAETETETTTTWKPTSAAFLQPPSAAAALWQDQLAAATITAPPTTTGPGALLP